MFSLCFDFLLLAIRHSLKDSLDYTLYKFWDFCEHFVCFRKAWRAWRVIHTTDQRSNGRSSQMRILFKGFCRLSLVWIAKQCGWNLVSSSSIINWWTRLSRKVKGLRILFGSDTKRQPGWVTPPCRYPPWYLFHEEVSKERWIEKKPKTCKCCYVMIASGNLSCDQSGCFCRRRLVSFVVPSQL